MRQRIRALWQHLRSEHTSPPRLAAAVFLGVMVGVEPIYGIQTPICIGLARVLRLNTLTVVLAANISNPLVAPFLVAGGIALGEWVRFGVVRPFDVAEAKGFLHGLSLFAGEIPSLWWSCVVGDTLIGLVIGAIGALVAYRVASGRREAGEIGQAPGDPPGG